MSYCVIADAFQYYSANKNFQTINLRSFYSIPAITMERDEIF